MEHSALPASKVGEAGEGRDLEQLLGPVRRGWKIVLLVGLLVAAATYFYYHRKLPTYTASTKVFLQASPVQSALGRGAPPTDPERAAANQAQLTLTPAVAQLAARKLDYHGDPVSLLGSVAAIPDPSSDFLAITATAGDPQRAADVANAFASGLVRLGTGRVRKEAETASAAIRRRLERLAPTPDNKGVRHDLQSQLKRLAVLETVPPQAARQVVPAVPPSMANGSPLRNAIFAGTLGLILGALLVYGLEAVRRRLPSSHAEEAYGLPLLAAVPFNRSAAAETQRGPALPAPMAEPARTLRTALNHGGSESPPRTILIASAIQGEGKSLVTKSLALGFFQGGARTLVIDGDLRKPSMHGFFDVEPEPGLSDVLRSGGPLAQSVRPILLDGGLESAREEPTLRVEADPAAAESTDEPQPWRSAEFDVLSADEVEELKRAAVSPQNKNPKTRWSLSKARPGHPGRGTAKAGSRNGATRAGSSVDHLGALDLLPCGSRVPDPAALLGAPGMKRLLSEAADSYDVVLVDSSPLLAVSDAIPLARAVDGVILVTRSDYTTRDAAEGLRRTLERLPDVAVVGLVANGVRDLDHSAQHRYRYPDAPSR